MAEEEKRHNTIKEVVVDSLDHGVDKVADKVIESPGKIIREVKVEYPGKPQGRKGRRFAESREKTFDRRPPWQTQAGRITSRLARPHA